MPVAQQDPGVMVWCSILDNKIIGPLFIEECTITGVWYQQLLQQKVLLFICRALRLQILRNSVLVTQIFLKGYSQKMFKSMVMWLTCGDIGFDKEHSNNSKMCN